MRQPLFILLCALGCTGCFLRKSGADGTTQPAPPSAGAKASGLLATPDPTLIGKVVAFNSLGQFVVLNFPVGRLPTMGQLLGIYHQGTKTGETRISGPQLDDNIVGDLTEGKAQAGDEVRSP